MSDTVSDTDGECAVVVGGANVDIQGRVTSEASGGESNPGRVLRSAGGVGRNIAQGLARLGVDTALVTALGDDADGRWLARQTEAAGVDLAHVVWSSRPTATYLAVIDADGELVVAVNDMAAIAEVDAAAIDERSAVIDGADVVVVDCNLDADTLAAVAARGRPLFVDPVSAAKAPRIEGSLPLVHTIKPNRAELAVLSQRDVSTPSAVEAAARSLLDRGVVRVVVSLGADGAMAVERDQTTALPAPVVSGPVGSVTGLGDTLLAGLTAAHLDGLDTAHALESALADVASALRSSGAFVD